MNRLADETSPYLRQHRDNPVDWYPWGDDAFAAARSRDVPILLSVGYSACHWCHVMAHECFEDVEVAERMNAGFVNVKVDREERPDVDSIYMDAIQAMSGRGGWPMTVFLTPDGEPFFGGTYYPKPAFMELLDALGEVWRTKQPEVRHNVDALLKAVGATEHLEPAAETPGVEHINTHLQALARNFDTEWGGFGGAPKFPSTMNLELLLRVYMTNGNETIREMVTTTLDAMASGGMYDHLAGGFARYSVDREWLVPHFEKMLYDQALLVPTYLHAFVVMRRPQWRQVVGETIEYVLGRMRHPDGGFFSAEDADSPGPGDHGVEGLFATWTPAEVRAALAGTDQDTVDEVLEWFGIDGDGNFEGRSIPNRLHARGVLARPDHIEEARRRLLVHRFQRPQPGTDDKVLTEWNAMFLSALAEAASITGNQRWLDFAVQNGEFLLRELRGDDGRWFRSWQADGAPKARHAALAADLAALVDAFTRLAEATGAARWIDEARATADTLLDWHFDPVHGGLFTSAEDGEQLVVRQKDIADNATPSANSMGAMALYRLAALTGEQRYSNQADRILQLLAGQMEERTGLFPNALMAADLHRRGFTEVAIVGDMPDFVRVAQTMWRPDVVLAWGEPYDSPLWQSREEGYAYVCRDFACQAPQDDLDGFGEQLLGRKVKITTTPTE